MNCKPYIPRPWQLPHLLATPVGGKVLIVERAKYKSHMSNRASPRSVEDCPLGPVGTVLAIKRRWIAGCIDAGVPKDIVCEGDPRFGLYEGGFKINPKRTCPREAWLLYRTTAIDLRRVDSMTAREANLWGVFAELDRDGTDAGRLIAVVTEQDATKERYLADNPCATWGDWAWFYTAERVERA